MATTFVDYNGDGNATKQFSFPSIKDSDIKVQVDGNLKQAGSEYNITGYTPSGGGNVVFTAGNIPQTSANKIHIFRDTDVDAPKATFTAGSSLRAAELNSNINQLLYALQEEQNQNLRLDKITDGSIPASKLVTGTFDSRYYTETESEALFLRQDSSETIASGDTWSGLDSKVATTAAIDARIIDLLDDVGGFVPVANETSFPSTNPDVNNGLGTVVSVKEASTDLTHTNGTITILNGAGSGNTVTITGCTSNIPQGFGFILETTTTTHTYIFHRLTAPATTVHSISTNISNINAVAANSTNINTVANNKSNIDEVADNESNINIVAGEITLAEDLGFITSALTTFTGNDINTVADNIDDIKSVATTVNASGAFVVDQTNKTTGSIVYYDGSAFKADSTTTKSSIVTGGNF